MRNFVSSFNYKTGDITLAINVNAPSGVTIGSEAGVNDADADKMAGWIIFLVVLGSLLLLIFVAWLIFCCVKSHRHKRLTLAYRSVGTVKVAESPHSTRSGGSEIDQEKERRESFTQSGKYKNHWS